MVEPDAELVDEPRQVDTRGRLAAERGLDRRGAGRRARSRARAARSRRVTRPARAAQGRTRRRPRPSPRRARGSRSPLRPRVAWAAERSSANARINVAVQTFTGSVSSGSWSPTVLAMSQTMNQTNVTGMPPQGVIATLNIAKRGGCPLPSGIRVVPQPGAGDYGALRVVAADVGSHTSQSNVTTHRSFFEENTMSKLYTYAEHRSERRSDRVRCWRRSRRDSTAAIASRTELAREQIVGTDNCRIRVRRVRYGQGGRGVRGDHPQAHAGAAAGGSTYSQMGRLHRRGKRRSRRRRTRSSPRSTRRAASRSRTGLRNMWVTFDGAEHLAQHWAYFAESVATFAMVMGFALILVGAGFLVLTIRLLVPRAPRRRSLRSPPHARPPDSAHRSPGAPAFAGRPAA